MLKPTANYRMAKSIKRIIDREVDPHIRGELKRSMINAQLQAAIQYKPSKNKKEEQAE